MGPDYGAFGALGILVILALLAFLFIMAILMPIFVYMIKRDVAEMNHKLKELLTLVAAMAFDSAEASKSAAGHPKGEYGEGTGEGHPSIGQ